MAQYINKEVLVAEIERLIDKGKHYEVCDCAYRDGNNGALYALKGKLDTLEVKEVDFENAYKEFVEDDYVYSKLANNIVGKAIAKHFFELGLKAQQNISINATDIDKVIEENGDDPNSKEAKMFKESYYVALEKLKVKK